jgi:hypothetical protein
VTYEEFTPPIAFEPRIRKSPYFEATRRYGAKRHTVYNHMTLATRFSDPVQEYWSLANDVTVWDVACDGGGIEDQPDQPDPAEFEQGQRKTQRCEPLRGDLVDDVLGGRGSNPTAASLGPRIQRAVPREPLSPATHNEAPGVGMTSGVSVIVIAVIER